MAVTGHGWKNIESDVIRVRDKTNARTTPRCVVCSASIEPVFTPHGAKVIPSRCPTHERKSHGRITDDGTIGTIGRAGRAVAAAARRNYRKR